MKGFFVKRAFLTLYILISGITYATEVRTSESTFLFCLKKEIQPLQISRTNNEVTVNNAELNKFFDRNGIVDIELWIPSATEIDKDGDIYFNRVYRAYVNENSRANIHGIRESINNLRFIHSSEPEYIRKPLYTPNDTNLDQQCSIPAVGADKAWDFWNIPAGIMPGNRDILLASVDTGVDYTHPDLWKNSWINQGEIPSWIFEDGLDLNNDNFATPEEVVQYIENGFGDLNNDGIVNLRDAVASGSPFENANDDDDNGYTDDLLGWDCSGTYGADDNDPYPREGASSNGTWAHGTHVAGILAATTDNDLGMASTAYNASIMSVKVSRDSQQTDPGISDGYAGITYAAKAGYYSGTFTIINNSWGGGGYSSYENGIVNSAYNTYGAIVLGAAGNEHEYAAHYPSSYTNCISVAAIGCSGNWGGWATYHYTVEFSAPGESIYSAIIGTGYESWDGSSMASPNAASCFGLMKAFYPDWTNVELRERMQETADDFIYEINDEQYDGFLGHGMIDVHKAIGSLTFPNLTVDTLLYSELSGDGDGVLNPGESASFEIVLLNEEGWQTALSLDSELVCDDENISTINFDSQFPNISDGSTELNQSELSISISSDIEVGNKNCTLNISGYGQDNIPYNTSLLIEFPVTLHQSGYPVTVGSQLKPTAVVVDVENDGNNDIIIGDYTGLVHRYNEDGSEVIDDVFPYDTGNQIWGSPAAADIDNDGYVDIAITSKSKSLYLFDNNGLKAEYYANSYLMGTPAIGQLDDDADLEVVVGGYSSSGKKIYAINPDGTEVAGFPVDVGEKIIRGVALYDFNGNGKDDIVFGSDSDNINLLLDDGTLSWSYTTGDKIQSAPSIFNLGSEILVCAGSKDDSFYCLNEDGSLKFSYPTGGNVYVSPSVVDIDGSAGIFFGSDDGFIYGVDSDGNDLAGWPQESGGNVVGSISFADFDGDGTIELVSTNGSGQLLAYNLDGTPLQYFPIVAEFPYAGSVHIEDMDGDGDLEIFTGTTNSLVVTDIKSNGSVDGLWNTFRGNEARTGYFSLSSGGGDCTAGDVNGDSIIDILDIVQTVNIVLGNINPTASQACAADVNDDDIIDILDIVRIVNIVLGN